MMTKAQYMPCNTPWLVQNEFETTIVDSMDNELAQIFAPDTQEQLEMARLMGASPELLGVALSLRAICGRQANILSTASDAERRDFINRIYELVNGDANAAIAKATGDFSVSQPQKTIAIGSSHGELIVDAEGNVIDRHLDNNDPDGGGHLASIIRFDLAEWRGYWDKLDTSDIDILDLGYWYTDTKTGRTAFAPPDAKWRSEIAEVLLERRTAAKAGAS